MDENNTIRECSKILKKFDDDDKVIEYLVSKNLKAFKSQKECEEWAIQFFVDNEKEILKES